jgi:hypothetical protein
MRIIKRNFERTEHDDYVLNVQPYVGKYEETIEFRDENGNIVGWRIQPRYS